MPITKPAKANWLSRLIMIRGGGGAGGGGRFFIAFDRMLFPLFLFQLTRILLSISNHRFHKR